MILNTIQIIIMKWNFLIILKLSYNLCFNIIIYIKAIYRLIIYNVFLSFFGAFKAGNLKNPGNKDNPNGYSIDKQKLINVSLIN